MTTPYDGYSSSSPVPSAIGYQANPQNYSYRPPYLVDAFSSGQSSYGSQAAQVPATSLSRYYTPTVDPSVASSVSGWAPAYRIADASASFSGSNGSHQNANLEQASHYASSEAYAYGRDMSLESPSTMRPSTDGNTYEEFGSETVEMQAAYMTSYSDTMPEPPEYYPPA